MTASPFAAMGNAQPGQPQDFNKLFKAERDNLEFAEGLHSWVGENMDTKILRKYGKLAALWLYLIITWLCKILALRYE